MTFSRHLFITATLLVMAHPAVAQEKGDLPAPGADTIMIGGGAALLPDYEGSDDYRLMPVVQARGAIKGFGFSTRGTSLYLDVVPDRRADGLNFGFGPVATLRLNRSSLKGMDDVRVRALGKLKRAVEIGGWIGISKTGVVTSAHDTISFSVAYSRDVADAHDSSIVTPMLEYGTPLSRRSYVGLSLSAERVGKGYGRYYYDVTSAGSAASGLPVYNAAGAKGAWKSWTAGLIGVQSLTGDLTHGLSLVVGAGYTRVKGRYAASPLVGIAGDRDQWMAAAGLAFTL